jgi:tetratricopeptide (TPR) repeat protein
MLLEESIALYRALGDQRGTAGALFWSGFVARVQEDYDSARSLLQEALHLSRAIGDRFFTAASLHHLGMMAADAQQDYLAAGSLLEESLTLYRTLQFPRLSLTCCSASLILPGPMATLSALVIVSRRASG